MAPRERISIAARAMQPKISETFKSRRSRNYDVGSASKVKPAAEDPVVLPNSVKQQHDDLLAAYKKAIPDPKLLNKYRPWTPEVYGETLLGLVHDFVRLVPVSAGNTFVDLGSGVGQVVLSVAAQVPCKLCFGVEKEQHLADAAGRLETNFRDLLKARGEELQSPVELVQGDMITHPRVIEVLKGADVVFVNNKIFGPNLNGQIVDKLFVHLKQGAKVVSFEQFLGCGGRTRGSASSEASWLRVQDRRQRASGVSWTDSPIPWMVHVVDGQQHSRLEADKAEVVVSP